MVTFWAPGDSFRRCQQTQAPRSRCRVLQLARLEFEYPPWPVHLDWPGTSRRVTPPSLRDYLSASTIQTTTQLFPQRNSSLDPLRRSAIQCFVYKNYDIQARCLWQQGQTLANVRNRRITTSTNQGRNLESYRYTRYHTECTVCFFVRIGFSVVSWLYIHLALEFRGSYELCHHKLWIRMHVGSSTLVCLEDYIPWFVSSFWTSLGIRRWCWGCSRPCLSSHWTPCPPGAFHHHALSSWWIPISPLLRWWSFALGFLSPTTEPTDLRSPVDPCTGTTPSTQSMCCSKQSLTMSRALYITQPWTLKSFSPIL